MPRVDEDVCASSPRVAAKHWMREHGHLAFQCTRELALSFLMLANKRRNVEVAVFEDFLRLHFLIPLG